MTCEYDEIRFEYSGRRCEYTEMMCDHSEMTCEYNGMSCDHNEMACEYNEMRCEYNGTRCEYDEIMRGYNEMRCVYSEMRCEYNEIMRELGIPNRVSFLLLPRSLLPRFRFHKRFFFSLLYPTFLLPPLWMQFGWERCVLLRGGGMWSISRCVVPTGARLIIRSVNNNNNN
jgi:hypothetical protein